MRKKMLGFAVVLSAALLILAACSADANSEFIGSWLRQPVGDHVTAGTQIYIFESGGEGVFHDGRFAYRGMHETQMIWNVEGDRLEIFFGGQLRANIYYFEFEDRDTLLLRRVGPGGVSFILTRQD